MWNVFLKSLVVVSLLSACASQKPITTVSESINKPYNTLYDACEVEPGTDFALCEIDGFRKALEESAEQTRQLKKLKKKLDAAEAHLRIENWFYEGQLAEKQREINYQKRMRWVWGGVGIAGGVLATLLTVIFAN